MSENQQSKFDFNEKILRTSKNYLEMFAFGVGLDQHLHEQISKMTETTAHDYANRVPLELIQNGYDAHKNWQGKRIIHMELDGSYGEFGALYVANNGFPFNAENFDAICTLGLSSKKPNENVGNKGIGFRSVLGVCEFPEIYSMDPEGASSTKFNGFCFSFARNKDIINLCDEINHADKAEKAVEQVSPYALPIPLSNQDKKIKAFAQLGFSTVIRLPLVNAELFDKLTAQLEKQVTHTSVPVLLFLKDLDGLNVCIKNQSGEISAEYSLKRKSKGLNIQTNKKSDLFEIVDLQKYGCFLFISAVIPEASIKEKILESLKLRRIPSSWKKWQGEANVELAIPIDSSGEEPLRLYNFLPMGENAHSPLNAYLNAPFYLKSDRDYLDDEIPLNSFLFEKTISLAVRALIKLGECWVTGENQFKEIEECILNLLCWDNDYITNLESEIQEAGYDEIYSAHIIPALRQDKKVLSSLEEVFDWNNDEYKIIRKDILLENSDSDFLCKELKKGVVGRLNLFLRGVGVDQCLDPGEDLLGEWIELIAINLSKKRFSHKKWEHFYDDLAVIGKRYDPDKLLNGRKILYCEDEKLREYIKPDYEGKTRKRQRSVFFQPDQRESKTKETRAIHVPSQMQRYLSFIHPDLKWHQGKRNERKGSLSFLEDHQIVRRYDTEEIFRSISGILKKTKSEKIFKDALLWVFKIHNSVSTKYPLHKMNLKVPTKSGWEFAENAYFSQSWKTENGKTLEAFLRHTKGIAYELEEIGETLLVSPRAWPEKISNFEDWKDFLSDIGVQDGLKPIQFEIGQKRVRGLRLKPEIFVIGLDLSPDESEFYLNCCKEQDYRVNKYGEKPETPHLIKDPMRILPGQKFYDEFSEEARVLYAELLVSGIPQWPETAFSIKVQGQNSASSYEYLYPTLCVSFLRFKKWLPIRSSKFDNKISFSKPTDSWLYSKIEQGGVPSFFPFVTNQIHKLLSDTGKIEIFKSKTLVQDWNSPSTLLLQLKKMGWLMNEGEIEVTQLDFFRHYYQDTLFSILEDQNEIEFEPMKESDFLVLETERREQQAFRISDLKEMEQPIYVVGEGDTVKTEFLEAVGCLILKLNRSKLKQKHINRLKYVTGIDLKSARQMDVEVFVNGKLFSGNEEKYKFHSLAGNWFRKLIVSLIAIKAQPIFRTPDKRAAAIQIFENLDIVEVDEFFLEVDGNRCKPPPRFSQALPFSNEKSQVIFVKNRLEMNYQEFMKTVVGAFCYLLRMDSLKDSFELSLVKLFEKNPDLVEPDYVLDDKDIADLLDASELQISELVESLRSSTEMLVYMAVPLLAYYSSIETALSFRKKLPAEASSDEISSQLEKLLKPVKALKQFDQIFHLLSSAKKLTQLREGFKLKFGKFNQILKKLGDPYSPLENPALHDQCMQAFKEKEKEKILLRIRKFFWCQYKKQEDLSGYCLLRNLSDLENDPAWLIKMEEPTEDLMWSQVDKWYSQKKIPPEKGKKLSLIPLKEAIEANRQNCIAFQEQYAKIAYCAAKKNNENPPSWTREDASKFALYDRLNELGVLDFEVLDDDLIMSWLKYDSQWVQDFPLSTNLHDWGLTEDEFYQANNHEELLKKQKEKERSSIEIDGELISAKKEDYSLLAEIVKSTVDDSFLNTRNVTLSLNHLSFKNESSQAHGGSNRGGGNQGGGTPGKRPSQLKLNAIGMLGELLAYQWLEKQYPDNFSEACWVSRMRDLHLGGNLGNDSLGYDFFIKLGKITRYFEVKATTGEACEIELGETEIREAQKYAADNNHIFRILFITNVN